MKYKKLSFLPFGVSLFFFSSLTFPVSTFRVKSSERSHQVCHSLYFDFGTNVGIQIRKLFEPELYPGSEILQYFDKYFGGPSDRRIPGAVCAIGVEPNIAHEERLKRLETSYNKRKWLTRIYTKSGVGTSPGWMNLKSDGDKVNNEWTAHLVDNGNVNENKSGAVRILDVVELMREILDEYDETYSNNSSSKFKRKVVVKVDIEGMDTSVINYMMTSGVLCKVDFVYVEHIHENEINSLNFELNAQGCPTILVHLDDELFYKSDFPLPIK